LNGSETLGTEEGEGTCDIQKNRVKGGVISKILRWIRSKKNLQWNGKRRWGKRLLYSRKKKNGREREWQMKLQTFPEKKTDD